MAEYQELLEKLGLEWADVDEIADAVVEMIQFDLESSPDFSVNVTNADVEQLAAALKKRIATKSHLRGLADLVRQKLGTMATFGCSGADLHCSGGVTYIADR